MSNILVQVGERIRDLRKQRGLSQEELGERSGFHYTYIGGLERGERNISLVNLEKVARSLSVDLSELLPNKNGSGDNQVDVRLREIIYSLNHLHEKELTMVHNVIREITRYVRKEL